MRGAKAAYTIFSCILETIDEQTTRYTDHRRYEAINCCPEAVRLGNSRAFYESETYHDADPPVGIRDRYLRLTPTRHEHDPCDVKML